MISLQPRLRRKEGVWYCTARGNPIIGWGLTVTAAYKDWEYRNQDYRVLTVMRRVVFNQSGDWLASR